MVVENTAVPRVSVLMTLYNKGAFVEEAARSVLDGSFTDIELLIVDDASTDEGVGNVQRIGDPRIRVLLSAKNAGRGAAANRGFDAARGEYVAILDADDIAHPERIARQVALMDTHPEVGACGSAYKVLGDPAALHRWPSTDHECRGGMLFGDPVIYGAAMFRRSVLEQHHLRCDAAWKDPGMDHLFVLSVGPHAQYANIQDALIYYRKGENNMRHGRDPVEDRRKLVRAVLRSFGIVHTEEQLDLQLAFHEVLSGPFDDQRVRSLWAWKEELARMNRERDLFPVDLFEAQLEHRWRRLFHRFADQSVAAALAHSRLSNVWSLDRSVYLIKTTINRWSKRRA